MEVSWWQVFGIYYFSFQAVRLIMWSYNKYGGKRRIVTEARLSHKETGGQSKTLTRSQSRAKEQVQKAQTETQSLVGAVGEEKTGILACASKEKEK